VWEAEERQALLQQEKANMAAELQAMEDQAQARRLSITATLGNQVVGWTRTAPSGAIFFVREK
jgi:hypothetical protein